MDARYVHLSSDASDDQLRLSPVLAETVARWSADRESSAVVIRHQRPYILLGPKDRRLPRLSEAVAWLNSLGYPVFMRIGGGSAVLLDEECLSFAVSQPCRDFTVWADNFRSMAQGVIDGLQSIGIDAGFGRASGSYCEGPYDLVADGKKIAGIAQAIRGGFALVSGMLLIRQDPVRTTALLQEFYERAGSTLILDPNAVTALARLRGMARLDVEQVEAALKAGFSLHYRLNDQPLTPKELELAQQLMTERQLTEAIEPAVAAAWRAGHEAVEAPPDGAGATKAAAELARVLADEVVGAIEGRITEGIASLEASGTVGDDSLGELVGIAYRDWKGARVDAAAVDVALRAYAAGSLAGATASGARVRWVLETSQPCADCDDNALSEPLEPGEAFPTGQVQPPLHEGCRCVLVAVPG